MALGKHVELFWDKRKFKWTIPLNESNIAMIWSTPGGTLGLQPLPLSLMSPCVSLMMKATMLTRIQLLSNINPEMHKTRET
jgi:hypothetical protein